MKYSTIISTGAIIFIFASATISYGGDFYRWVDDGGSVHYADSLSGVPPRYRDQIETREFKRRTKSTVRSQSAVNSPDVAPAGDPVTSPGGLKKYEVPYRAYVGTARRIIISVTFNGSVTAPMILDTGAPGLVVKPGLAAKLGLFGKKDGMLFTWSGGIGGYVPAIFTIIDSIQVGGARSEFVPTTISPMFSGPFQGLVGMSFMDNYAVTIDTRRRVVVFQETPPRKNMPAGHDENWWRINFHNFSRVRKAWSNYLEYVKKKDSRDSRMERIISMVERQRSESVKLFNKLERYASYNAVPMHWRKY